MHDTKLNFCFFHETSYLRGATSEVSLVIFREIDAISYLSSSMNIRTNPLDTSAFAPQIPNVLGAKNHVDIASTTPLPMIGALPLMRLLSVGHVTSSRMAFFARNGWESVIHGHVPG